LGSRFVPQTSAPAQWTMIQLVGEYQCAYYQINYS
jgi:hypothetical protein